MLRVLQIMGSLQMGGLESTIMELYRRMDREKIQFDFLLNSPEETHFEAEAITMGSRIFRRERRTKNFFSNRQALIDVLRQNPDIRAIHIHGERPILALDCITAKNQGIKVRLINAHNMLKVTPEILLARPLLSYATHWGTCSHEAALTMFGKSYTKSDKMFMLRNARNLTTFAYNPELRESSRKVMKLQDNFVLLAVGRLTEQKNYPFLLNAMAQLIKLVPSAVLMIAGEGELQSQLEAQTQQLMLDDHVHFLGKVDNVPLLIQMADVFVMPSLYEGLPGAAIEAQAAGLPSLLSDAISPEAGITAGLVKFLPLQNGTQLWADAMASLHPSPPRRNTTDEIRAAGYDSATAALELQNLYLAAMTQQEDN